MTHRRAVFLLTGLLSVAVAPMRAFASDETVQFCWASGKFDETIYFAETNNRNDRRGSFEQLLEISGIEYQAVRCYIVDSASHQRTHKLLLDEWRKFKLSVVNTTFLSDLDY